MDNQERILKNKLEAVAYLNRRGFKVGKSKLYADCKKGLVRIQADGSIFATDLESYARRQGLDRPDMDGSDPKKVEELQEIKLRKEVEKLDWENKRRQFEYEKETGKHIPRELLELELASRAAVMDSQLRTKIRARAREWTAIVQGSSEYTPELITDALDMLDQVMNEFARMDRFQVIFADENEEQAENE